MSRLIYFFIKKIKNIKTFTWCTCLICLSVVGLRKLKQLQLFEHVSSQTRWNQHGLKSFQNYRCRNHEDLLTGEVPPVCGARDEQVCCAGDHGEEKGGSGEILSSFFIIFTTFLICSCYHLCCFRWSWGSQLQPRWELTVCTFGLFLLFCKRDNRKDIP